MDRRRRSLLHASRMSNTKLATDSMAVSASWDKTAATCRRQLVQPPLGPSPASKKLQPQQQDMSRNQIPTSTPFQQMRQISSKAPPVDANKRIAKVPKLAFDRISGKQRRRHIVSNQLTLGNGTRQVNAGVYVLENSKSGHRYFGTTWDLQNAAAQSFHDLKLGVHPHHALAACFQQYGEDASGICFRVLELISPPTPLKSLSHGDESVVKRRRLTLGRADRNNDGFDVRAMERKLEARLRFHRRKAVRRVAFKIVRRLLIMPVLARAWPRWIQATKSDAHVEHVAAAVEIQCIARRHFARVVVAERRRDRAARILQRFMRRSHFISAYKRCAHDARESKAARVLQRSMKELVARNKARRRRQGVCRWLAARKLQAYIRGTLSRRLVGRMRLTKLQTLAAIHMQRLARGYLARLRVQYIRKRFRGAAAATQIQKMWRGFSARARTKLQRGLEETLSFQRRVDQCSLDELQDKVTRIIQRTCKRWKTWRLHDRKERAATIRTACSNYVARMLNRTLMTVLFETSMANRNQRVGRRWILQGSFRRDKAAQTIQCFMHQVQARETVYALRVKKRRTEAARQIQAFWRTCWIPSKRRGYLITQTQEQAARYIQTTYCSWLARRGCLAMARRNDAAAKVQCMFRVRQARRELMRRQVVRCLGACEHCRSQLATVYNFNAESELCAACSAEFTSLGDLVMKTLSVEMYRRVQVLVVRAQRAYHALQARMRLQFGTCTLCEKHAVRRSCWSCLHNRGISSNDGKQSALGLLFCRSCDALFHERKELAGVASVLQHQRKDIERAFAEDHAALTIQKYYRWFAQQHKLAHMWLARQSRAANRVQECYRRHRQRRITHVVCAAHRRYQLLKVCAAVAIQCAARRYLAQCKLQRLKSERDSAIKLQRAFRRYRARKAYEAAVVVQRHIRGWLARRVAAALRQECLEKQRSVAACCIQRHVRGFLAKRCALHIRQHIAAVSLQSVWRGHIARGKLHALRLEKQQKFTDEVRQRLNALAAQIAENERIAATRIQTMVRWKQAQKELYKRKLWAARNARELLRGQAVALEVTSATCIQRLVRERLIDTTSRQRLRAQCCARCFLSRRIVNHMRLEKRSVVRIQRAFRRSRAQRRLARLVGADSTDDNSASPWVEFYDEASGYVYYYHNETGQSVWKRPPEISPPEHATNEIDEEWVEYWDGNVGASYFYNIKTGEATWATPAGYQSIEEESTTNAEA